MDHTFTLATGPWTLSIDAPGHATPAAQVVDLVGDAAITLDVAALAGDSTTYMFGWNEDGSFAGHATEFVLADPPVIDVLGEAYTVPAGFSAQTLFQQYGFVLDDPSSTGPRTTPSSSTRPWHPSPIPGSRPMRTARRWWPSGG